MAVVTIGAEATNRAGVGVLDNKTRLSTTNLASGNGVLDTFEVYLYLLGGDAEDSKIGTFYGSGSDYTCRDYENIGAITAGSKQTFTGLNCVVQTNDLIGIWSDDSCAIQRDENLGNAIYASGDKFTGGSASYSAGYGDLSLHGSGEDSSVGVFHYYKSNITR